MDRSYQDSSAGQVFWFYHLRTTEKPCLEKPTDQPTNKKEPLTTHPRREGIILNMLEELRRFHYLISVCACVSVCLQTSVAYVVYIWNVYVSKLVSPCGGQNRMSDVLFHHFGLYFPETGSLTQQRTRLVVNEPRQSTCLPPSEYWSGRCDPTRAVGIQKWVLILSEQVMFPTISSPTSTSNSYFKKKKKKGQIHSLRMLVVKVNSRRGQSSNLQRQSSNLQNIENKYFPLKKKLALAMCLLYAWQCFKGLSSFHPHQSRQLVSCHPYSLGKLEEQEVK